MAERAGATITEVEGSHVIMISQPEAVADVILTAAAAVDRVAAQPAPSHGVLTEPRVGLRIDGDVVRVDGVAVYVFTFG